MGFRERISKKECERSEILKNKYRIKDGIGTARIQDLISDYNPNEPDDPISIELKKRFGDLKIIVLEPYSEIPTVAIEETLDLITDYKEGRGLPDKVMMDGTLVETFAVGERPYLVFEEDPLFQGEPLRSNFRSNKEARLDWKNCTKEAMQFVRIAVELHVIDTTNRRECKEIWNAALQGVAFLEKEYPDVALEFRKCKKMDNLPKLKIVPDNNELKKNQPFGIGNRTR